jgi:hypothetical protein
MRGTNRLPIFVPPSVAGKWQIRIESGSAVAAEMEDCFRREGVIGAGIGQGLNSTESRNPS